jgi:hypothetical protein
MLAEISARMYANTKEMDANQAEMRSTVLVTWSELKESIQHEMKAVIQPIQSELDEMTTCNEATETEPDQGMMESIEKHQEIPKEGTAGTPVKGPRKLHGVCSLAVEHHKNMREMTQGYRGSRRKAAATCKNVSCCAKVAWGKFGSRQVVNCGSNWPSHAES